MRRSQANASDIPAPAATPFSIAIVGFGISCSSRDASIDTRSVSVRCSGVSGEPSAATRACTRTSPPAQNAPPSAGDHHTADRIIHRTRRQPCEQRLHHLPGQCVQPLRPVQREHRDAVLQPIQQFLAHHSAAALVIASAFQDCSTGSTSLANSRSDRSAVSYGMPPKRNAVSSSNSPITERRDSSSRRMRSGVPHTAAFMKPAIAPSMPAAFAIAAFCA